MAKKPSTKKPKSSSSPIRDFIKAEADKRKLPVVVEQPKKTRGNTNKANPPKVINQGHTPGSASRAVVPYEAPKPSAFKTGLKAVAKTGLKVAGAAAGFAVGMIADAKPAGAGSDKPSGPLMKGNAPRKAAGTYTKPYDKPTPKITAGLSRNAFDTGRATTPAATPKRAAVAPPKPTARPSMKKGSTTPPAYTPEKAQKRGNVTSGFSGNWSNAAPTDMQKRGGARIDRGGGLFGKLRKK